MCQRSGFYCRSLSCAVKHGSSWFQCWGRQKRDMFLCNSLRRFHKLSVLFCHLQHDPHTRALWFKGDELEAFPGGRTRTVGRDRRLQRRPRLELRRRRPSRLTSTAAAQRLSAIMRVLFCKSEKAPLQFRSVYFQQTQHFCKFPEFREFIFSWIFFFACFFWWGFFFVVVSCTTQKLTSCVYNSRADGQLGDGVFNVWCHMKMIHSCIMLTMCFWHSNKKR